MSTTLTNGIIIPENGSRNWGGDLANNWNIIDVNVGYMNDVKNRVTTLENSVAENTANIQTNASNISALQTSKQDVIEDLETIRAGASAGATAVQPSALNNYYNKAEVDTNLSSKANDSDVVHKSGDETIKGNKYFDGNFVDVNGYKLRVKGTNQEVGVIPTDGNKWNGFSFCDKNNKQTFAIENGHLTNGNTMLNFSLTRNLTDSTSYNYESVRFFKNSENCEKCLSCDVYPSANNKYILGTSFLKWKDIYATNAAINTSDRNAKTSIENIDDNLLDAWGNVSLVSFKFKDAVEKKGDGARIHTGYIAQNIQEELNKYGIDACKYGLFCYNSWDAQEEKSHEEERTDENGTTETVKIIDTPAIEAGETFGLRYIECLVVECAYLRKKNEELADRIAKVETNLLKVQI